MEETDGSPIYEACPACGSLLDVTDQAPFSQVFCPSCGQGMRARKQFNNFTLLEVLGEGGMGSVFKALDVNLQRHVAVKILRREFSLNEGEKQQLVHEARITASINHPNVVKVYSFGEDHGQFYFAMELVERGSLDDLMQIQRRIAEVQVLEFGIQVSLGLQAAFEKGLIHRDIKPGNILFADAHTAKLVDFGLALLMAEEASARGEIWGTPYYIAPEKLDNRPEDFRSDIYSLGGTLFHALAGRPPYEAETASMVALKQIKSRPISLQAFAPDVTSETAYVINRMLAKEPDDRYQSYQELVDHLSYARQKLLERTEKPRQPKQLEIVESKQMKNFMAMLSIFLLVVVLGTGVALWVFREPIFGISANGGASAGAYSRAELEAQFAQARQAIIEERYGEAVTEFRHLLEMPGLQPPLQRWVALHEGFALLLDGDMDASREAFKEVQSEGLYPVSGDQENLMANFFVEAARLMASPNSIHSATAEHYRADFESFGLLLFAMKDWELGEIEQAGKIFRRFFAARLKPESEWIAEYRPWAQKYLDDYKLLEQIERARRTQKTPEDRQKILDLIQEARNQSTSGSRFAEKLDQVEAAVQAGS